MADGARSRFSPTGVRRSIRAVRYRRVHVWPNPLQTGGAQQGALLSRRSVPYGLAMFSLGGALTGKARRLH
jgi:hypothetical protein